MRKAMGRSIDETVDMKGRHSLRALPGGAANSLDPEHRAGERKASICRTYPARLGGGKVLLLQGPAGPFFRDLQSCLRKAGIDAQRICFNTSDRFYSSPEGRIRYRGGLKEWYTFLGMMLESGLYSDIVLFGAERPVHRIAREVAAAANVRTICLEEGYVRPGFITAEEGGNNASSPLAGRMPDCFLEEGQEAAPARAHDSFGRMCFHGAVYYGIRALFSGRRDREIFHRKSPIFYEAYCWARSVWRRIAGGPGQFAIIQDLLEHADGRFYLVPLQVAVDANIRVSARGWTSSRLIESSIASFSTHAPRNTRLVFKVHPMDRGHNTLTPFVMSMAAAFGVADRIDVIETGSLGLLARHCAGMLTINSTSGLSAIYHGVPLLVLGDAIYAHPDLATCARSEDDIHTFWTAGHVASPDTRRNYIVWIKQNALKPGDFYAAPGIEAGCAAILEKLHDSRVSQQSEVLAS